MSLNEVVRLQCPEASRLARRHWERPNSRLSPDLYLQQDDGSLRFLATPISLGHYLCVSVENGFQQVLAVYQVKQKSSGGMGGLTTSQPGGVAGGSSSAPSHTTQARRPTAEPGRARGRGPLPTSAWGPWRTDGKGRGREVTPRALAPQETPGATLHKTSRNFTFWLSPALSEETSTKARAPVGVTPTKETSGSGGDVGVRTGGDGEQQLQANTPCYLQELVVVSVLLVLSASLLLTLGLYGMRQRCRSRTAPQACARRDAERGGSASGGGASTPQEREALRGSPRQAKRNGQAHNNGKGPVTLCNGLANGSNGHLPNTPI